MIKAIFVFFTLMKIISRQEEKTAEKIYSIINQKAEQKLHMNMRQNIIGGFLIFFMKSNIIIERKC